MDGDELVLTYFEDLDSGSEPAPGAFEVTVDGGTPAAPSSVGVSGKTVTLTLATAVTSGQTVTVSYTPGSNPIQDESGLAAAALTNQAVINNTGVTNTAATGQPGITGTPQVGQALTATLGTIADTNGLPSTFPDDYSFQWVRVDANGTSNPVNVGTDSEEYTPAAVDVGKKIKVEVTFTDGGGTEETRASNATPAAVLAARGACPAHNDWCAEMTVGDLTTSQGFSTVGGALSDTTINYGGDTYTVTAIAQLANDLVIEMDGHLDGAVADGSVFDFDGTEVTVTSGVKATSLGATTYTWTRPAGLAWLVGQKVTVSANLPPGLDTATVNGDTLVLRYFEDLDTGLGAGAGRD